jgi:hypothetical protein
MSLFGVVFFERKAGSTAHCWVFATSVSLCGPDDRAN